jgi:hypothetical protein
MLHGLEQTQDYIEDGKCNHGIGDKVARRSIAALRVIMKMQAEIETQ